MEKKLGLLKNPEETLSGTEETLSGPEICTEGVEEALRDPDLRASALGFPQGFFFIESGVFFFITLVKGNKSFIRTQKVS